MASYVNVDGFQDSRYLARSWALLNLGGGLAVTILKLGLVSLIPIVGPLIVLGFTVEWARQISWGVSCPPGSQTWSWGGYLSSGWRAFVVQIGYGLIVAMVVMVLGAIPLIGQFIGTLSPVIGTVISVFVMVAVMHAAIYQRIGAGFNFSRAFQMFDHDTVGLLRVLGFSLLAGFCLTVVYSIIIFGASIPAFVANIMQIESLTGTEYNRALFDAMMAFAVAIIPGSLVSLVINGFVGTLVELIKYGMVGLWMRQFNVANWGREEDPLPPTINAQPTYTQYTQPPTNPAGTYQQQYYDPNYYDPSRQQAQQPQAQPTPTWQEMDAEAQQLWQQQYEAAQRRAPQQAPQQAAPAPQPQMPTQAPQQLPEAPAPREIDGDSAETTFGE